ncbi:MAG: PAS domain-containing protein [Pirellulales bacterium]|nr:PAS domain-containing protein [Pirellulales bacterium]
MFCSASALAWAATWNFDPATWVERLALVGGTTLIAVGAVTWLMRCWTSERRLVAHYLHDLAHAAEDGSSGGPAAVDLPALLRRSVWGPSLEAISAGLAKCYDRTEAAEMARTALEIRIRRATEEQARTNQILAHLSDPVLVVDKYDELVLANDSASQLLHLDEKSTEQRAIHRLLECEKLVEVLTDTRRRPNATTRTEEIELCDEEGQARWYSVTASNMARSGETGESNIGGSAGAVAVLRDVTSQKASQKRHAEFVSAVSHEMKTPLAGIKAYVELLADGDAEDEETREEFLNVINSQADRLQRLIDNMLNLARIEAGVVKVDRQHRALNEILEEAASVVQPSAEKKHITLVTDLSPMYLGVLVDRDMLLQAAINLLSNAIKYTRDGGTVTLRSRMSDGEVQLEVEDTGVGLSPEDSRRVFEKFYRVKKDSDMAPGTGLGLALVKHIVEDVHNGKIEVTSQLGEGSTFVITLPSAGRLG